MFTPTRLPVRRLTAHQQQLSTPLLPSYTDANLPLLSEATYEQLLSIVIEHALLNNFPSLIVRLADLRPEPLLARSHLSPGRRQLLVLRAGLVCLRSRGPLPEIMDQAFVSSLHESLFGLFGRWSDLAQRLMTRTDLAQLVCGLRFLTLLTVLKSPDKFTAQNVVGLLTAYFPLENSAAWAVAWKKYVMIFRLEETSGEERESFRTMILTSGLRANKYIGLRLRGGVAEREKDRTESVLGKTNFCKTNFCKTNFHIQY